ncbi:MAG: signal peptidase II [Actinobacteria bacterium]|nr:signal peptidase II [Actinomycetota bacterium]
MSTAPNQTSIDRAEGSGSPRRWLSVSLLLIGAVVLASWAVELLIVKNYAQGSHHVLGPLWIHLTYNSGASFSILQGSGWIPALLSSLVTAVLFVIVLRSRSWLVTIGGSMAVGGGLANLLDRLLGAHHGAVADYLWTSFWPTFNLADCSITVGIVLVLLGLLISGSGAERGRMVYG